MTMAIHVMIIDRSGTRTWVRRAIGSHQDAARSGPARSQGFDDQNKGRFMTFLSFSVAHSFFMQAISKFMPTLSKSIWDLLVAATAPFVSQIVNADDPDSLDAAVVDDEGDSVGVEAFIDQTLDLFGSFSIVFHQHQPCLPLVLGHFIRLITCLQAP